MIVHFYEFESSSAVFFNDVLILNYVYEYNILNCVIPMLGLDISTFISR